MNRFCRTLLFTAIALRASLSARAQAAATQSPEMASELRSSGKIYVVVLVLTTIFAGIIAFLIYLERRVARMERGALPDASGQKPDDERQKSQNKISAEQAR